MSLPADKLAALPAGDSVGDAATLPLHHNPVAARRRFIRLAAIAFAFCGLAGCTNRKRAETDEQTPAYARMSEDDIALADKTVQQALEGEPSGAVLEWYNRGSGNSGSVTPVRTYKTTDGTYCREYREIMRVGHESETYDIIACRHASGQWQPI